MGSCTGCSQGNSEEEQRLEVNMCLRMICVLIELATDHKNTLYVSVHIVDY